MSAENDYPTMSDLAKRDLGHMAPMLVWHQWVALKAELQRSLAEINRLREPEEGRSFDLVGDDGKVAGRLSEEPVWSKWHTADGLVIETSRQIEVAEMVWISERFTKLGEYEGRMEHSALGPPLEWRCRRVDPNGQDRLDWRHMSKLRSGFRLDR